MKIAQDVRGFAVTLINLLTLKIIINSQDQMGDMVQNQIYSALSRTILHSV
jgi:hypothetical protein